MMPMNFLLLLDATLPQAAMKQDGTARELANLEGVWWTKSKEVFGKETEVPRYTGRPESDALVIVGDRFAYGRYAGRISVDPAKETRTVDRAVTDGLHAGKTIRGVYEV